MMSLFYDMFVPGGVELIWPQKPKPRISLNPAFCKWRRHEPLPLKWICSSKGISRTGNTEREAYDNWLKAWVVWDCEEKRAHKRRYEEQRMRAMQNAGWGTPYGFIRQGGTWI